MVHDLAPAAALALAAVYAWAGAAKLTAPTATESSFAKLGLPAPTVLARLVPIVELGLAFLLVVGVAAAPVIAIVLLAAFTVVLTRVIRSGSRVVCSCFGTAGTEPISSVDLVRNGFLVGLSVLAIGGGGAWPTLPAVVTVSLLVLLGRVGLAVMRLGQVAPLWPGEPQR
ncbi:MAG: DoxX family protein [Acidimicrobiales bacterium]